MHLYFFLKLRRAFRPGRTVSILIGLNLILLVFSPVAARMAVREMILPWAYPLSYAAYFWLAFLFLFCATAFFMDSGRAGLWLMKKMRRHKSRKIKKHVRSAFLVPSLVAISVCLYGYHEAHDIKVERVEIPTQKLTERIRIAQISDVHLGVTVREDHLSNILAAVKKAQPDMLVSTGDLIDADNGFIEGLHQPLQNISPRLGKYAVLGNHEFIWSEKTSLDFMAKAGFKILRASSVPAGEKLIVAGVDDPAARYYTGAREADERRLLSSLPQDRFILFLKHRPVVDPAASGLFDLQLSGHSHKGQIFPFSILTWFYYPRHAGKLHLVDGSLLYVNRGTGTWGPPIRFLAPPEVTIIDLVPQAPLSRR
ncbi:MAG TPA: metallophosphoesterase [Dissulfurispiraceae bacterium]|nr:metallophosphoesterase [Dissulfurispiraceae bacterium]